MHRRPPRPAMLLARAACVSGLLGIASAWGPEGHERMARIASMLLKGKHKDQIRSLMHGDLVDLSDWEKKMTETYPDTGKLHWHHQEPEWTCAVLKSAPDAANFGADGQVRCHAESEYGSLFCALAYFFEHFAHDALLKQFPKPKQPIETPKSLDVVEKLPSKEQKPSSFLRWLTILIGDLHQPLHWLRAHDYGKEVIVRYKDEEYNLLSFWEDYIPKHLPEMPSEKHARKQYEGRAPKWWDSLPTELFRDWAKEVAEVVCSQVYAALETNSANGTRTVDNPVTVDEETFQRWLKLAHDFTTLGGERLAFVLNDILEHKRHKAKHKDGRGHLARIIQRRGAAHVARHGFGWNLGIAVIVVPGLLALFNFHLASGGRGLMVMGAAGKHRN